jgi:hypothetical protein
VVSRLSFTEECEYGEYSAVGVGVWFEIELLEDLGAGGFDCAFADVELVGDAGVGSSFGHQCEDLAFAGSSTRRLDAADALRGSRDRRC